MNESTRMRLRSGAVLDLGSSCSEVARDTNTDSEMDRQDDSLSIEAQWGTPLTTSQSTAGSRSPAPDSQQEQIGPSTSRQGRGKNPYVPTSPSHHVEDGYEPGSGHASASAPSRHPNPQPQPESLQRFSSSTGPWNPASPTETPVDPESLKRRYSDVAGMDEYELDRSYPDKLETELDELGEKSDADSGGDSERSKHAEHNSKKRKRGGRKSKRRDEGSGRETDSDRARRDRNSDTNNDEGTSTLA